MRREEGGWSRRGVGWGGLGAGGCGGRAYHVRSGVEKLIFKITIGLSAALFVLAILNTILS